MIIQLKITVESETGPEIFQVHRIRVPESVALSNELEENLRDFETEVYDSREEEEDE